jgi:hypothetical protein
MSNYSHNISQPEREYDRWPSRPIAIRGLNLKLVAEWTGVMEV